MRGARWPGIVMFLLIGASSATARESEGQLRPIPVDTLLGMTFIKEIQPITVTADGRRVAFTIEDRRLKRPVENSNTFAFDGCRIMIADTSSGSLTDVSPAGYSAWMPTWSPDESVLAFFADDGSGTHLWTWSATSGAKRLSRNVLMLNPWAEIQWVKQGSAVVVPSSDLPMQAETAGNVGGADNGESHKPSVEVWTSPRADGNASARGPTVMDQHLIEIDLKSGEATALPYASSGIAAVAPDGNSFVYARRRPDIHRVEAAQYQSYSDLWLVSLKDDKPVRIAEALPLAFPLSARASWSPDGQFVAYRSLGLPAERKVVIVRVGWPSAQQPFETNQCPVSGSFVSEAPLWMPDSSAVIFPDGNSVRECSFSAGLRTIATIEGVQLGRVLKRSQARVWFPALKASIWVLGRSAGRSLDALYELDPRNGAVTIIAESERNIGDPSRLQVSASDNGEVVVFPSESASEPADLWMIRNRQAPQRLTTLNPALSTIDMGKRELLEWTNPAGQKGRALLLLPAGYVAGRKYPTIVWVYQQATSNYANTFGLSGQQFYNLQMFATRGYAVLFPDIDWKPGSVMRGIGEQVIPAVDHVIQRGLADPERIGVLGHSSGGYDVLSLLVQTNRFRAAMESNGPGIYDLASEFASRTGDIAWSDWVTKQMGIGAPPWKRPQTYIENSPGYHLDEITTPLLMLEGLSDTSDNVAQSEYLFSALSWLGKPVEYRRYPGEPHAPEWWSPANKRDAEIRMLNWFSEYLGGAGAGK